jgi:hypothetical protein
VTDLHPKYGFDRSKVPSVCCLWCGHQIGDAPYKLVTMLARFGTMLFEHRRCPRRKPAAVPYFGQ